MLADDHRMLREGLRRSMTDQGFDVIGEARDGDEAIRLAEELMPEVILMDVTMPGKSGTDLLEHIRSLHPSTPVLVYSMHSEESYAVRMIRSGASGYLNKSTGLDELVAAMRSILAGQEFVNPAVARCLIERMRTKDSGQLHDALSNREFQILRMVAQGESLKQIALTLCVSANTVSTYRTRILQKLRLKTNAELTRYALEHALI